MDYSVRFFKNESIVSTGETLHMSTKNIEDLADKVEKYISVTFKEDFETVYWEASRVMASGYVKARIKEE